MGCDDGNASLVLPADESHNQAHCDLYDYSLMTNLHAPVLTEQRQCAHGRSRVTAGQAVDHIWRV